MQLKYFWIMSASLLISSCGELVEDCSYQTGSQVYQGFPDSLTLPGVAQVYQDHDSTQKDSLRLSWVDSAHTKVELSIKSRCQKVIFEQDALMGSQWYAMQYESNWEWSGVSCEPLDFTEYQAVSMQWNVDSLNIQWSGSPCAESTNVQNDDDLDDDHFDWD